MKSILVRHLYQELEEVKVDDVQKVTKVRVFSYYVMRVTGEFVNRVPGMLEHLVHSLTTIDYLFEVFFRLWIPSLVHISTSAWTSTGNLSQGFFGPFSVGS